MKRTVVIMSASLAASLLVGAAVTAVAMPSVSRPVDASAGPNFAAAQHVCEAFGGDFVTWATEGYGCLGVHRTPKAYPPAQRICENAYDGIFHPRPQGYVCDVSD